MRQKAQTVPISVSSQWVSGDEHTRIYPGLMMFGQNHIQMPAFPINAAMYSTPFSTHIVAMSGARHCEPAILAEGI